VNLVFIVVLHGDCPKVMTSFFSEVKIPRTKQTARKYTEEYWEQRDKYESDLEKYEREQAASTMVGHVRIFACQLSAQIVCVCFANLFIIDYNYLKSMIS
jgi:hypothetical protein